MAPALSSNAVRCTDLIQIIPYLVEQHAKGNYLVEEVITFYDMKDHEKAIADTKTGKTLKAVLRWSQSVASALPRARARILEQGPSVRERLTS